MAAPNKSQQVEISELPVQQLELLRQQVEQEMEVLTSSLQQLKMAQQKFTESEQTLSYMTNDAEGSEMLLPLTSSMYVPGTLLNVNNVMIDIGTGYFVEKTVEEAQKYFKRKIEFVTKNMEKIQPLLQEKFKIKQAVVEMLQMKMQAQIAAKQQGSVKT